MLDLANRADSVPECDAMYDTPVSLHECCIDFICDNLSALCDEELTPLGHPRLVFKDQDIYFQHHLSESLLEALCEKGKLTDESLTLFDPKLMNLRQVCIQDAQLSTKGLRTLKQHKILDLEITGLKSVTINDVIGCLGEWSLTNLRSLNVSNSTFLNSTKFCVVVSLSKLRNLVSLNVSRTEFNKHGLEIIAEDLPKLENLDISVTPIDDISALRKCKERLKFLSMYSLRAAQTSDMVPVLSELTKLVHLDVSDDSFQTVHSILSTTPPQKFKVANLLSKTSCLPRLSSLDISGKDGVTGEATEKQVVESLRRYTNRALYMQKSLYTLFSLTQEMFVPREDIIKKNALLTLCSDRMLQDVQFDRFRCARLVMECLCLFDDPSMNRMSVAICSILAAKISTQKTSQLGAKTRYMKKMLQLVRQKIENNSVDITLKFTLNESPATCKVFLNEGGLELFMMTLQVVSSMDMDTRVQVETKILGLLNNIAEVSIFRNYLMREDFLMIANDGEQSWLIAGTDRADILTELYNVVLKWEQPNGEMVAYSP
ncbi:ZYG11-like protein [Mya arenaria]|uniref:ZYG11-like protein n=1 Tax=Mya arenaria TaxID=6604 RepID=A0ABY7FPK1_MYAAR|nr:ZYG11-like protein [Mya arenaria]